MKINKFVLYIVFLLLLSGCSSNSYYSTLEKAVSKSIPYKVSNILHIEEVPEGAIVFYISPKDDHHVIGVTAFKKEDGEKGWKSVGPLDLTDYKTELISFNVAMINFYPQEPFNKKIPVIFGQIKDTEIKDVIVGKKDGTSENVEILETSEGKFYFKIGRFNIVKALNMNDEILYSFLIEHGDEILDFP